MQERKLTRREVRERLNATTRYAYEQLISDKILDPAIKMPGRHPFHTESQVLKAERRLTEKALAAVPSKPRITRPLSQRMREQAQRAREFPN